MITQLDGGRTGIHSYCILCRTGAEKSVAQTINQNYPKLTAIAPVKILQEKRKNQWEMREQILLPGYIFLFTEHEFPRDLRLKVNNLYRTLQYEKNTRMLTDSDAEYAAWIYRNQGRIGSSRIIFEGQDIQVIDGPLLDCQGTVIKLDKHKRRALVAFTFDGQKRVISIGAECVLAIDSEYGNITAQ